MANDTKRNAPAAPAAPSTNTDGSPNLAGMTQAELLAYAQKLQQGADIRQKSKLAFSINDKGQLSVRGFGGNFPVQLCADQWEILLGEVATIRQVLAENAAILKPLSYVLELSRQKKLAAK